MRLEKKVSRVMAAFILKTKKILPISKASPTWFYKIKDQVLY
ncbi:MAG TPA: hypothetical protein PKD85_06790 [Saprospiraceae bacterium]|nr:hypothetical protein [Saprospiraceae bacterium]